MAGENDRTQQIPSGRGSGRPPVEPVGGERHPGPADRDPYGGGSRVTIGDRGPGQHGGPGRFRLDLLQVVAWLAGIYLLISGLVALARAGFADIRVFEPAVQVGGFSMTPLLAFIAIIVGLLLLAGGTGEVQEGALRFGGAVLGVVGIVWLIEPGAFAPYLGITEANGMQHLIIGAALIVASFVPPADFHYETG